MKGRNFVGSGVKDERFFRTCTVDFGIISSRFTMRPGSSLTEKDLGSQNAES